MPDLEPILKATILTRCIPILLMILCCVVTALVGRIEEKRNAQAKKEKSALLGTRWNKNDQAALDAHRKWRRNKRNGIYLAAAILMVFFLFRTIPACGDLIQERYVAVSGEALFGQLGNGNSVTVKTTAGTLRLELPANWEELGLPAQDEYGQIWYSQQSKILLAFCESGEDTE